MGSCHLWTEEFVSSFPSFSSYLRALASTSSRTLSRDGSRWFSSKVFVAELFGLACHISLLAAGTALSSEGQRRAPCLSPCCSFRQVRTDIFGSQGPVSHRGTQALSSSLMLSCLEGREMVNKNVSVVSCFPHCILFFFTFFFFIIFFIVVDFVIHWNETAMGLHVFPIPIPPPTSLSTRSL